MRAMWQKINEPRRFCHWWHDHDERMITAMTLMMILLALSVLVLVEALVVAHDGHGPDRPPTSRFEDPQFLPPASR